MPPGERTATIKAKTEGFDASAKDVEKLAGAEQQLGKNLEDAAGKTKDKNKEQEKLNAGEGDYIDILRRINPALGDLADGLLKGSKVAGDMASKQIDLGKAFGGATDAIKNNAGALKLLGAGGAVFLGISAISSAMARMRQEAELTTKAAQELVEAFNEVERTRRDQQASIEKSTAGRFEGPVSADEAAALQKAFEGLGSRVGGFVSEDARARAVTLGGADASADLLDRIAILIDQFPGEVEFEKFLARPLDDRLAAFETILARREDEINTILARERQQAGGVAAQAQQQASSTGGTTVDIVEFINTLPGRGKEGLDVETIAKIVQVLFSLQGGDRNSKFTFADFLQGISLPGKAAGDVLVRGQSPSFADLEDLALRLKQEGLGDLEPTQIRFAEIVTQQLQKAIERSATATEKNNELLEQRQIDPGPTVTNNDFTNSTFIGPDADSETRRAADPIRDSAIE